MNTRSIRTARTTIFLGLLLAAFIWVGRRHSNGPPPTTAVQGKPTFTLWGGRVPANRSVRLPISRRPRNAPGDMAWLHEVHITKAELVAFRFRKKQADTAYIVDCAEVVRFTKERPYACWLRPITGTPHTFHTHVLTLDVRFVQDGVERKETIETTIEPKEINDWYRNQDQLSMDVGALVAFEPTPALPYAKPKDNAKPLLVQFMLVQFLHSGDSSRDYQASLRIWQGDDNHFVDDWRAGPDKKDELAIGAYALRLDRGEGGSRIWSNRAVVSVRRRGAPNDAYCSARKGCSDAGLCWAKEDHCVARDDRGCRASKNCWAFGECSHAKSRCLVTRTSDCASSWLCRSYGRCTSEKGRCVIGQDSDCEATLACRKHKRCRMQRLDQAAKTRLLPPAWLNISPRTYLTEGRCQ